MAEAFNLNNFLQTYKQTTYDPTKQYAATEQKMEDRLIQQAQDAVKDNGFLKLTLSEKIAEFGIGERVLQQFTDTATNMLKEVVNPITDYLEKYANIFDEVEYNKEIQSIAKQTFDTSLRMQAYDESNVLGGNFTYRM